MATNISWIHRTNFYIREKSWTTISRTSKF